MPPILTVLWHTTSQTTVFVTDDQVLGLKLVLYYSNNNNKHTHTHTHTHKGHSISHANSVAMQENGVCIFEITWHVLVNVIIIWGYIYSGAHTFCSQVSLCWQPCSEMEVRISTSGAADGTHHHPHHFQRSVDNLRGYFKVVNGLYDEFMLYSLFHVHFLQHNKTITPWFKMCVVCFPPTSGSCTCTVICW
jgi:hypothetical protein